ncbi:hypothetical protein F4556_005097 [Kitasatospora gansuensis]|uniref:Uncharacterized protein n=1 Tax=Kitasatospora gansuensis TaxID=258050 RepID=A0A7W7SFS2_9ACTN|nr:hypothetical protein [Kitasatospora gansuensis]MBB4949562.1 hypothetical protein [Kitasatospora gansuensis]
MSVEIGPDLSVCIAEIRGPKHHLLDILNIINSADCISAGIIANGFAMVEHAISVGWGIRPDGFHALTFKQFHELVRHRYYTDLYWHAIEIKADYDRIGGVVTDITVALLNDPQLNS